MEHGTAKLFVVGHLVGVVVAVSQPGRGGEVEDIHQRAHEYTAELIAADGYFDPFEKKKMSDLAI